MPIEIKKITIESRKDLVNSTNKELIKANQNLQLSLDNFEKSLILTNLSVPSKES